MRVATALRNQRKARAQQWRPNTAKTKIKKKKIKKQNKTKLNDPKIMVKFSYGMQDVSSYHQELTCRFG